MMTIEIQFTSDGEESEWLPFDRLEWDCGTVQDGEGEVIARRTPQMLWEQVKTGKFWSNIKIRGLL